MRESNEIEILFGGKNSESLKEVVLHLVGEFILVVCVCEREREKILQGDLGLVTRSSLRLWKLLLLHSST